MSSPGPNDLSDAALREMLFTQLPQVMTRVAALQEQISANGAQLAALRGEVQAAEARAQLAARDGSGSAMAAVERLRAEFASEMREAEQRSTRADKEISLAMEAIRTDLKSAVEQAQSSLESQAKLAERSVVIPASVGGMGAAVTVQALLQILRAQGLLG